VGPFTGFILSLLPNISNFSLLLEFSLFLGIPVMGAAFVTVLLINLLLKRISYFTGIMIIVGIIMAYLFSMITIRIIPFHQESMNIPDAIKLGYPILWGAYFYLTALFVGKLIMNKIARKDETKNILR
jgi:undecaprenyl pyrophosphate phosphatase UppP